MRHSILAHLLLALPISLLDLVIAQYPLDPISLPTIDFSSFGQAALGGDFQGISLYQFEGQNPASQQGTGDGVYIQLPNGALGLLGRVEGAVSSLCTLSSALYVAGKFSSISGVNASNIASYNFTTNTFSKLNDRDILGSVATLYCDGIQNLVYVGGSFQSEGSNNAIAWNVSEGHWVDLPFSGFDGPVSVITPSSDGNILFGGTFDALGNGTTAGLSDKQVVNLLHANVTSTETSSTPGFTDPSVLFCNNGTDDAGSTWLLQDNTPGSMTVLGSFGYRPTRLRLRNTHFQGRGTKTWRLVAEPINGIMNFTYTDPASGQTRHCDARCPLSNDTSISYQDFEFVNVIGINGFTLFISDWYGDGGGLSGLELFEDDIIAYADNNFNEPTCQVPNLGSFSSTEGGPFESKLSFPETSAPYLSSDNGGSITMAPQILETGDYSIRLFTPGCIADGTCTTRGIVIVQTFFDENEPPRNSTIYQTNNYDKYDTIFQGRVQASSSTFQPRIVISPAQGQPSTQNLVAQKVQFMPLDGSGDILSGSTVTGSLNGIYEYSPSNWTGTTNVTNTTFSAFDVAGTQLGFDAVIAGIVPLNGRIFVAGDFQSTTLQLENVMIVNGDGSVSAPPDGGLNGPVTSLAYVNGSIYFGGEFTGTANQSIPGLNNVAGFNTVTNSWFALDQGLNGNVTDVVLVPAGSNNETVVVISGMFTQIEGSPSISAPGLAIWIPSLGDWVERIGTGAPFAYGSIAAETVSSNGTVFIAGDIQAWQGTFAQGIIGLGGSSLNAIPFGSADSNVTKKRWLNSEDVLSENVITAGAYYTGNNSNITVVAGQFSFSQASNLAFIDGSKNAISTLPPGLSANASIYALLVDGNILYIGGDFTGTINSKPVDALAFYDFSTSNFDTIQPPALSGDRPVLVNALTARPSNSQILVGGRFASIGSLPCPAVCIYDTSNSQWQRPGNVTVDGEVSQIVFEDENTALVVGNISIGGNNTFVGTYNFQSNIWTSLNIGVTGPVDTVVYQDPNNIFLAGQNSTGVYFGKWNASGLGSTSQIIDMQFLPLSSDHAGNSILSSNLVILLLGNIQLAGFGNASAVLYDGSSYQPYILTTKLDGSSGTTYTFFSQRTGSFSSQNHLGVGWVIFISLAISLFLILLLVIGGVIAARIRRARDGYLPAPGTLPIGEKSLERVPPEQLFEDLEGRRTRPYPIL